MGMLGSYSAHFYCDVCNKFEEALDVQTASAARKQMREGGWKLLPSGAVICPTCIPSMVKTESDREGCGWNVYQ